MWVVVIGGVAVWFTFTNNATTKMEKAKAAKGIEDAAAQKETQGAITQLGSKYNAVSDWNKPLSEKSLISPIFTIEVEDALLRKDNRPVLFLATVKDVERKENKYCIRFLVDDLEELGLFTKIEFILECTEEQAKTITHQPITFWTRYAVIADIQKVEKAIFNLKAESDSEETKIGVSTNDNIFFATGKCLDLLFVGNSDINGE
jgi:hypothetical protein